MRSPLILTATFKTAWRPPTDWLELVSDAAQAFFEIATDSYHDVQDRLEAADRLAALNEQQGAEALFEIGTDDSIDTEDRREAAQKLTGLNEELAAKAFDNIATDENSRVPLTVNPRWALAPLALILVFFVIIAIIVNV